MTGHATTSADAVADGGATIDAPRPTHARLGEPARAGRAVRPDGDAATPAPSFFADLDTPVRTRHDRVDVAVADRGTRRRPAVVFVHGGPVAEGAVPTPRDSQTFAGYGALAAAHGLAGVVFDHRLHTMEHYPLSADDLVAAVDEARGLDEVDPERIALWFFSGGGGLAADWLRVRPTWLRALTWTYPVLAAPPDWPGDVERFDCVRAVTAAPDLPKLLVRVGAEFPQLRDTQQATVDAARAAGSALEVIDLPMAVHGYELHGHDPVSREATDRAMAWTARSLGAG